MTGPSGRPRTDRGRPAPAALGTPEGPPREGPSRTPGPAAGRYDATESTVTTVTAEIAA
ncbi:hypothetical protein QFZ71_001905 [Streptomyces sp. V2I9]|nr:hypothetical protein [Streptomyces sp. V2I9]